MKIKILILLLLIGTLTVNAENDKHYDAPKSTEINKFEYLKFDVNRYIKEDDSIIDLPQTEKKFTYLKFNVNNYTNCSEELPQK